MKSQSKTKLRALSITLTIFLLAMTVTSAVSAATITTVVDSIGNIGRYTSMALSSNGFPIISYHDVTNGDLKLAICGNTACSLKTLTTIDSAGWTGLYNSMAINPSGFPVISYYDGTNGNLKVATCGDVTCSSGNTLTTVDSTGSVGLETSLALNSNGFPVISYLDGSLGNLKVAVCGNATCTSGNILTTVDSAGWVGEESSLVLNNNGFPIISYYDNPNGNLIIAVCGNATCSSGNTLNTIDSTGNVGRLTSLILNNNGFPIISYYDNTNGDLKIAVCGNVACSSGNILTTIDSAGNVGRYASLKLSGSGFPIISYFDDTNLDLKLAVCNDAVCSSKTISTIDNATWVGEYTSLALNNGGFPIISYYDGLNGDLKMAEVDVDTVAPTVATTSLLPTYTVIGPNTFSIIFSENVNNVGGGADIVTNPANYRIINKGPNDIVDTTSCAVTLGGDDTQVAVGSVQYIPNTAVVTLANPLSEGNYRLFVCGTTSIVDLALNPLNGGTDYTFDFTVNPAAIPDTGSTTKTEARSLPRTGFAPNITTFLPSQPADLAYTKMSDLWLEIPSQNIKSNIVGVPQTDTGWDVRWLGQDAGWLNGTSFPTWKGNSVITGHVTNANGLPGPFTNLKNLKYGDQIIIHLLDQQYIFEVQSTGLVRPETTTYAFEHLEGNSYITLVTCQNYDLATDSYSKRRVVRAVLVSVK